MTDCQLDGVPIASTATAVGNTVTFDGNPAGAWDVPVGKAIVCQYTATALSSLYVNGGHTNTVDADWSSLDGAVAGERIYDDSTNYTVDGTQDTATVTFTVAAPTFTKSDGGTTQVAIGNVIHYVLRITSPLGTIQGLTVQDVLPKGLIYNGDAAITRHHHGADLQCEHTQRRQRGHHTEMDLRRCGGDGQPGADHVQRDGGERQQQPGRGRVEQHGDAGSQQRGRRRPIDPQCSR